MNALECATAEASKGVGDMVEVGVVIEQLKEGTAEGGGEEDNDVEDPDPESDEKDVETLNCSCSLCCSCWI